MPAFTSLVRRALLIVTLALMWVAAPQAQPFIDGITVGVGLTNYHGDLDWNQNGGKSRGPMGYITTGNLTAFAGADRAFGNVVGEVMLSYTRINVDFPQVEATLSTTGIDLTVGYMFDVFRPSFLRVYAGVAPLFVSPTYDRVDQETLDGSILSFERQDSQMVLSFPFGIVIQDTFRLGVRFMSSDNFDGAQGPSGASDFLSLIQVGYRIDLLD